MSAANRMKPTQRESTARVVAGWLALMVAILLLPVAKAQTPSYSITEEFAYHDNKQLWVMGQVSSIRCVSASQPGCIRAIPTAEVGYDATTALPLTHKAHGKLRQSLTYHANGSVNTIKDGRNQVTTLSNWYRGVPRSVKFADLSTQTAEVNALGHITALTDENGHKRCLAYDALGRLTQTTHPSETQAGVCDSTSWNPTTIRYERVTATEYGIAAGHWRQTVTTGRGVKVMYFDGQWRPLLVREYETGNASVPERFQRFAYDHEGRTTFTSVPARSDEQTGTGTRTEYDSLGRVTAVKQDSELSVLVTTTEYLNGLQTRVTNPRGKATTLTHMAFDQPNPPGVDWLVELAEPEGRSTEITRDAHGKPLSIKRRNADHSVSLTRAYVYNGFQELCKTLEPELVATVQVFDAAGNLAWRAPGVNLPSSTGCDDTGVAASAKISHVYDARNRLTNTSYGDASPAVTRTYWSDGLPRTVVSNGSTWTYDYNRRRLLTRESLGFEGKNYAFARGYDANGHASTLSYPTTVAASPILSYAPNALGQPTQIGSFASAIKFHPNGAVAEFKYGNAILHSQTLNARGLPLRQQDGSLLKDLYSYDKNGNVDKITDEQLAQFTRSMTYDGLDRLRTADAPGVWGHASYSYDVLDNLTAANVGSRAVTLAYDTKNRLEKATLNGVVIPYGYDARGNLNGKGPSSYGFDLGNRLTHVNQINGYVYDGHGRRTRVRASDGSTRVQVYGHDGKLLWSTNSGGGRPTSSTAYIHLGGKLIAEWDSAKGVQYLHTDALGSPVARSNGVAGLISRTRYEAYGQVAQGTKPGPATSIVGFTGHVQDPETDLVYMQQRYYDPVAGRFLSADPIVTDANTGKLFGRYHYAENNPFKFKDPDGRCPVAKDGVACTAVLAPGVKISDQKLVDGLNKIAAEIDKKIEVYSGDRDPGKNDKVGGAKDSAHITGNAADVKIPGMTKRETAKTIYDSNARKEAGIRQVYHRPDNGKLPEHTHLDTKPGGDLQQNPGGGYTPLTVLDDNRSSGK